MPPELREPWTDFLLDLDFHLQRPVGLHCLGGFVVTACYGLPRATADIDLLSVVPHDSLADLLALAGKSSTLHRKHGIYLDFVAVATCPYEYEDRLIQLPGPWERLRLFALDPYDVALAKLERNLQHDRDDVLYLAQAVPLDLDLLRTRYHRELRPYLGRPEREDLTLQLWIEMIQETRGRQ
jgi:hypothetical protein